MENPRPEGWGPRGRGLAILVFTLVGLLNFSIVVAAHLAETGRARAKEAFLDETTGVYAMLVLVPAVLWFLRRFPIARANAWRRLPLHAVAFVLFGASHTLLMWGSRSALWALLGWGRYDYGVMSFRFAMEGFKQLVAWLVILGVETGLAAARRNRERLLQAERLERELTEARLTALKMQLNPHFLFNALHMIAGWVREDPAVAEEMIARLSDFLRLTLRHSGDQLVTLRTELAFLDAYLAIMKARFEERLAVEVDVPEELRETLVPHLVLQPLVENALEHCTTSLGKVGRLRVAATRDGRLLRLTVADNGPGLNGADPRSALASGVGLSNTVRRLEQLFGDAQRLALSETEGGGLTVTVEVPARTGAPA
jgi:signal transduction histidine kinase